MQVIKCHACKPEDSGCTNCGGFKVKLQRIECQCGHAYWDYPRRGETVYEGKRYRAFDGTTVTIHFDGPNDCSKCEQPRPMRNL